MPTCWLKSGGERKEPFREAIAYSTLNTYPISGFYLVFWPNCNFFVRLFSKSLKEFTTLLQWIVSQDETFSEKKMKTQALMEIAVHNSHSRAKSTKKFQVGDEKIIPKCKEDLLRRNSKVFVYYIFWTWFLHLDTECSQAQIICYHIVHYII